MTSDRNLSLSRRGLQEITPQDFERVFSVNVAGQLFVT